MKVSVTFDLSCPITPVLCDTKKNARAYVKYCIDKYGEEDCGHISIQEIDRLLYDPGGCLIVDPSMFPCIYAGPISVNLQHWDSLVLKARRSWEKGNHACGAYRIGGGYSHILLSPSRMARLIEYIDENDERLTEQLNVAWDKKFPAKD